MNKQRGEVTIKVSGQDFIARPTHEAIASIEAYAGKGIIEIANNFLKQRQSKSEIIAMLFFCIKATQPEGKMPWNIGQFEAFVFKQGLLQMSEHAMSLAFSMVTGETEQELIEKNEKPTG